MNEQQLGLILMKYFRKMGFLILNGSFLISVNLVMAMQEPRDLYDFTHQETSGVWMIVNDGVMGGVSESNVSWEPEGVLVFEGILSLDYGGGFASTRTWSDDWQMGGYEGIILSVRGDGRKFQFRCRLENTFDGISYRHSFATAKGEWLEIVLPLTIANLASVEDFSRVNRKSTLLSLGKSV